MAGEFDMNSAYDNPNNLVDLFEQSVVKYPNNRLFGTKNPASDQYEWVTFKQVAARVDNLRGGLNTLGLEKGEKVGVILNNCTEWFICEQAGTWPGRGTGPHVSAGTTQSHSVYCCRC